LTAELAPWLLAGLSLGIEKEVKNWEMPNIESLGVKISQGFKTMLEKVDWTKDLDSLLNDDELIKKFNEIGVSTESY
jgi:antitoxin component of RelBE/YafQ-DinJ toxin-antitoxin module